MRKKIKNLIVKLATIVALLYLFALSTYLCSLHGATAGVPEAAYVAAYVCTAWLFLYAVANFS